MLFIHLFTWPPYRPGLHVLPPFSEASLDPLGWAQIPSPWASVGPIYQAEDSLPSSQASVLPRAGTPSLEVSSLSLVPNTVPDICLSPEYT